MSFFYDLAESFYAVDRRVWGFTIVVACGAVMWGLVVLAGDSDGISDRSDR
jgi:hypothetical protein